LALFCLAYIVRTAFFPTNYGHNSKWFIFLTNWGFFILTAHFLWAAGIAIHYVVTKTGNRNDESAMRWFHGIGWLLFNSAVNVALLITVLFWALLYPSIGKNSGSDNTNSTESSHFGGSDHEEDLEVNIVMHTLNTLLSLTDIFFSGFPVRLLHAVHTMIIGSLYAIFTVIYWAAGGTNNYNGQRYIYPVLDYSKWPGRAAANVILSVLVALPLAQVVTYGCYQLRRYLVRRYYGNKPQVTLLAKDELATLTDSDQ
jgi:hypothetical protein